MDVTKLKLTELISAAEQGLTDAMYELGMRYYAGVDVAEDEIRAIKWIKKAADNGDDLSGEVYKQWVSDRQKKYLVKMLGEDYIAKYGMAVAFDDGYKKSPLDNGEEVYAYTASRFSSVEFAKSHHHKNAGAFFDDSDWIRNIKDKVGKKLRMCVYSPFYCEIGKTFSIASYCDSYDSYFDPYDSYCDHFITCQLLGINRYKKHYFEIAVKVLSVKDSLSFLKQVSDNEKAQLEYGKRYSIKLEEPFDDCYGGGGVKYYRYGRWLRECIYDEFGAYNAYIYTDDSGIDHLLQIGEGYGSYYIWFGDKVLGYHKYCPVKIEEKMT